MQLLFMNYFKELKFLSNFDLALLIIKMYCLNAIMLFLKLKCFV